MFSSETPEELHALLNAFRVPMFVVEQVDETDDFRLLALNKTHETTSGMSHRLFSGHIVSDMLPEAEATRVNGRYLECLTKGQPIEYRETLTLAGHEQEWNTSLIPVSMEGGRKRIVGTSILTNTCRATGRLRRVFEDIRFFSVQSEFQLSQVSAYLDAIVQHGDHDFRPGDLQVLSGLCRSIDRCLHDIRELAEPQVGDPGDGRQNYLLSCEDHASVPGALAAPHGLDRLSRLLGNVRAETATWDDAHISLYRA